MTRAHLLDSILNDDQWAGAFFSELHLVINDEEELARRIEAFDLDEESLLLLEVLGLAEQLRRRIARKFGLDLPEDGLREKLLPLLEQPINVLTLSGRLYAMIDAETYRELVMTAHAMKRAIRNPEEHRAANTLQKESDPCH